MPKPLTRLLDALPENVRCAALPTPFAVGPVNCYLLPDHPVTVVDPGMLLDESLSALINFLAADGLTPRDVELVVVTHGHPDHFGAAAWLARQSGAPIITGRHEIGKICLGIERVDAFRSVLTELGLPESAVEVFPAFMRHVRTLVQPATPDMCQVVEDGERLTAGGRRFEVLVTPGHAASHVSLWDGDVLLSGDHLLPRISPNPFLEIDDGEVPTRRRSLVEYLESLNRFVALDPACVAPGHGEAFSEVPLWADRVRAHHGRRAREIRELLVAHPGSTAYSLTQHVFPQLDGFEVMLGVSEVVGHLDLLAMQNGARVELGPVEHWFAT